MLHQMVYLNIALIFYFMFKQQRYLLVLYYCSYLLEFYSLIDLWVNFQPCSNSSPDYSCYEWHYLLTSTCSYLSTLRQPDIRQVGILSLATLKSCWTKCHI